MKKPYKLYLHQIKDRYDFHARWPPIRQVRIGDVGMFRSGVFEERTTVKALGLPALQTRKSPVAEGFDFSSKGTTIVEGAVRSSSAVGQDRDTGLVELRSLEVSFSSSQEFLFSAQRCSHERVADLEELAEEIRSAKEERAWNPGWSVVIEVVWSSATTVLIAGSSNSRFKATGRLAKDSPSLLSGHADLKVESCQELATRFVAAEGFTPLFKVARIKKKYWGEDEFDIHDIAGLPSAEFIEGL